MLTNSLLDFLLNLFANPEAADDFRTDPEGALAGAGFKNLCSDDVDAVMPVILDGSPITMNREYNTGGNNAWGGDAGGSGGGGGAGGGGGGWGGGGGGGGWGGDDHAAAVQQLVHVLNNYSYTSIDDRDVVLDQSVNQNIWANGDVHQLFDQSAVIASGDQSNAAGDDLKVDDSYNTKDSYNDNSDNSVEVEDDHSTHIKVDDSFNDESETKTDNSVDNSVEIDVDDSFNDESEVKTDNSVDVDVDVDDSFNDESETEIENDVDIDADLEYTEENYTDSVVVQDNETEVEESIVLVPVL